MFDVRLCRASFVRVWFIRNQCPGRCYNFWVSNKVSWPQFLTAHILVLVGFRLAVGAAGAQDVLLSRSELFLAECSRLENLPTIEMDARERRSREFPRWYNYYAAHEFMDSGRFNATFSTAPGETYRLRLS